MTLVRVICKRENHAREATIVPLVPSALDPLSLREDS